MSTEPGQPREQMQAATLRRSPPSSLFFFTPPSTIVTEAAAAYVKSASPEALQPSPRQICQILVRYLLLPLLLHCRSHSHRLTPFAVSALSSRADPVHSFGGNPAATGSCFASLPPGLSLNRACVPIPLLTLERLPVVESNGNAYSHQLANKVRAMVREPTRGCPTSQQSRFCQYCSEVAHETYIHIYT